MRESIGTVSLLNFVIFYILLVFAFLAGTLSYYKAYRVNNAIITSIEKYEGFNTLSYNEINQKLASFTYERVPFKCASTVNTGTKTGYLVDYTTKGKAITSREYDENRGYCVYRYANDTAYKASGGGTVKSDWYDTYEVMTVVSFRFPIIQNLLKLRVFSRTSRIYQFETIPIE